MSFLDGASECWWLSKSCTVNWDAWSAIGTLLAVVVAIRVSAKETRRRREDQAARAMWLRLELAHPVSNWQWDLFRLKRSIEKKRYFDVVEKLTATTEERNPIAIPDPVAVSVTRLHDLGSASKPLAEAVYLVRTLEKNLWLYVETFRELQTEMDAAELELNAIAADEFGREVEKLFAFVKDSAAELRSPFSAQHVPIPQRIIELVRAMVGLKGQM